MPRPPWLRRTSQTSEVVRGTPKDDPRSGAEALASSLGGDHVSGDGAVSGPALVADMTPMPRACPATAAGALAGAAEAKMCVETEAAAGAATAALAAGEAVDAEVAGLDAGEATDGEAPSALAASDGEAGEAAAGREAGEAAGGEAQALAHGGCGVGEGEEQEALAGEPRAVRVLPCAYQDFRLRAQASPQSEAHEREPKAPDGKRARQGVGGPHRGGRQSRGS